jgi:hypothetical protein
MLARSWLAAAMAPAKNVWKKVTIRMPVVAAHHRRKSRKPRYGRRLPASQVQAIAPQSKKIPMPKRRSVRMFARLLPASIPDRITSSTVQKNPEIANAMSL